MGIEEDSKKNPGDNSQAFDVYTDLLPRVKEHFETTPSSVIIAKALALDPRNSINFSHGDASLNLNVNHPAMRDLSDDKRSKLEGLSSEFMLTILDLLRYQADIDAGDTSFDEVVRQIGVSYHRARFNLIGIALAGSVNNLTDQNSQK